LVFFEEMGMVPQYRISNNAERRKRYQQYRIHETETLA